MESEIKKIVEDLRRIGSSQAGALETETGEVWHPANLMLLAADKIEKLNSHMLRLKSQLNAKERK